MRREARGVFRRPTARSRVGHDARADRAPAHAGACSLRLAHELRRLPVDSPTAWRVAALCVRRLSKSQIGARIPSLGRMLEAACASPPEDAFSARALREAAAKQGIAEA